MCGTTPNSACEAPCAHTFGLPFVMNGTTPISVREVPCALKPHVHNGVSRKILGSLSERGCQWSFLDWVKNSRPYDLNIDEGERKMCPMIWCRQTFETNDLTIHHVSNCPRLSNAWYWCPYHRRPERFLKCNKGCEIIRKPKIHQAAKFFNLFGRRRSLKKQAQQEEVLIEECQSGRLKRELGASTDNEVFESSGSDTPSSKGSSSAMTMKWVDERASYPGRQSQIAELHGGDVGPLELAAPHRTLLHEMHDTSTPPPKLPISGSLQRQSSPELLHPINSESDRDSLWQRMRGIPTGGRHRPDANQCRSDRHTVEVSENMLSSSSLGHSKLHDSLHSVPNDGDRVPASTASSETSCCPDEPSDSFQFWLRGCSMSRTDSPDVMAPTADCAVSNIISPISPNTGFASPPSNVLSPVGPMTEYVYPPLTLVTPTIVTRDDSGSGMVDRHEDDAGCWNPFGSSPVQSTLKEKDSVSQRSLRPISRQFQFENLDTPSNFFGPYHSNPRISDSKSSVHSGHFDESSESEVSSSMIQSVVTQIDTSRRRNSFSLPYGFNSGSPPPNTRIGSSFQSQSDVVSPSETTRPTTAFHSLSSSATAMPEPMIQKLEVRDDHTWAIGMESSRQSLPSTYSSFDSTDQKGRRVDSAGSAGVRDGLPGKLNEDEMMTKGQEEKGHELKRSKTGQSSLYPDLQLRSPPESLIATVTSELSSNSPQRHLNDSRLGPADEHQSLEFATAEALSSKLVPHCFDHSSLLVNNSAPKQILVAELKDLVRIVSKEWTQRVELAPELRRRCKALLPSSLFERAVRTLKDFTYGICAMSFEDVFALMHLAFAAAFFLHWQHDFYSWDVFYGDALQWQHVLSSNEDKILFLNAMSRWWRPELKLTPLAHSGLHTSFGSIMLQQPCYCDEQETLSNILRNSEVYKVCIGFLDGFEKADVSERIDRFQPKEPALYARSQTWESQQMMMYITQPLLQRRGIEALRRIVIDTELLIDRGLLYNPREVEVTLKTSGRWSSESREVFDEFHDSVTFQCDAAMSSSAWRNSHYIDDLDGLLEISEILDRQRSIRLPVKTGTNTSVLAVMRLEQSIPNSPISVPSTSNGKIGAHTMESSPTSAMSWTPSGSSCTADFSSHTTSPTTISQASISPTSPSSRTPAISTVWCLACSKPFNGKNLQDANSNLRRHLRESPRHNKNAGLKCPLPECHARPPRRSDNLSPHLLNFHKISSASERSRIVHECRLVRNQRG